MTHLLVLYIKPSNLFSINTRTSPHVLVFKITIKIKYQTGMVRVWVAGKTV